MAKILFKKAKKKGMGKLLYKQQATFIYKDTVYDSTDEQVLSNIIKNNEYIPVYMYDGDIVECLERAISDAKMSNDLQSRGAYVMFKRVDGVWTPIEYFIIDNGYNVIRRMESKTQNLKALHQRHNASKKFKMRQAVGRDRVQAFKLRAMGIKEDRKVF
ncbi:MAG: hypothetical protein ACRCX2_09600 [Paraclostridium sp.]